jgi:hypothetical protein
MSHEKSGLLAGVGLFIIGFSLSDGDWGGLMLGIGVLVAGAAFGFHYVPNRSRRRKLKWLAISAALFAAAIPLIGLLGEASKLVLIGGAAVAAFGFPWLASRWAPEDLEARA